MNNKQILGAFATFLGIPLFAAVLLRTIDGITVNKALEKVIAYNEGHPENPIAFSMNK